MILFEPWNDIRDGDFAPTRPAPTRAGIPRPVEVTGLLRVTKIALILGVGRSWILFDPPRPEYIYKITLLGFSYINPFF